MMARAKRQGESVMDPMLSATADVYAEALMDQVEGDAGAEEIAEEIEALVALMDDVPDCDALLTKALMDPRERYDLVERVFRGRVSDLMAALLAVLAKRDRMGLIRAVAGRFRKLIAKHEGKIEVDVITVFELSRSERGDLSRRLEGIFGAEPILSTRVDESLLGGMVVHVGDVSYDASVAGRLRAFSRELDERIARQDGTGAMPETEWP